MSEQQPEPEKWKPRERVIVAEVSKSWPEEMNVDPTFWKGGDPAGAERTLAGRFELVILVNEGRGYELDSWRMTSTSHPVGIPFGIAVATHRLTEKIVAVFRLAEEHVKRDEVRAFKIRREQSKGRRAQGARGSQAMSETIRPPDGGSDTEASKALKEKLDQLQERAKRLPRSARSNGLCRSSPAEQSRET